MAPSFAHMPPYAKAAFIAAQLDALAGPDEPIEPPTEALLESPVKAQVEAPPAAEPAPEKRKKKRKLTASNRAKTILRAAKIPKRSTDTDDSESTLGHHRRKCQVCNHPDREAIEELFIAWHSPRSIRVEFGAYRRLDCSSIYRHARAAGLYAKRRQNLRAVFDLILEHAGNIAPTAHGIAAIVRAYTCLTDTHQWIEPERRVHVVNHVYRHDVPATSEAVAVLGGRSFSSDTKTVQKDSSFRAPYLRDVVASQSASEVSSAPSFASGLRQASQSEEVAKGRMPLVPCAPAPENSAAPVCPNKVNVEIVENGSSFRACPDSSIGALHPRDVLASVPADSQSISSASAAPPAPAPVTSASAVLASADEGENGSSFRACPDSSIGAPHLRDVVPSEPAPADSQPPSSQVFVGADRFHRPAPSETDDNPSSYASTSVATALLSGGRSFSSDSEMIEKSPSSRATHSRDVVGSLPASLPPCLSASVSNRHTPKIRIASNSHITNDRRISNRHISHPVSTQTRKEKSAKTPVASRKDKKDKMDG